MTLTISTVRSWDFATVTNQLDNLRSDSTEFRSTARAVREGTSVNLGEFECYTVTVAKRSCNALSRDIAIVGRKLESLIAALEPICNSAPELRRRLLDIVIEAEAAGCTVGDDGFVQIPPPSGDPTDPEMVVAHKQGIDTAAGFEDQIMPLLRELEQLDLDAANALNLMTMTESYESYPYEPDEVRIDPKTVAAGTTISASTGATKAAAEFFDASSPVLRGLPLLGTGLNLAIGFATKPEDESVAETLAVEGGAVLSSALAGAAVGSVVPGAGTAAGFVAGAAGSPLTSKYLRQYFNDMRANGKEDFRW